MQGSAAGAGGDAGGALNFLFMAQGDLPLGELWYGFFQDAPPDGWRAFLHCSEPQSCNAKATQSVFPGLRMVQTVQSSYCQDLVSPMVQLLKESLAAGAGPNDKFIFVSDSTVPLKPFADMQRRLRGDRNSDFCIFPSNQWAKAYTNGQTAYMVKHHQWVVLNYAHAKKVAETWNGVANWRVPVMGYTEKQPGSRAYDPATATSQLPPGSFSDVPQKCTDEWAIFTMVFGAVPIDTQSTGTAVMTGLGGGPLNLRYPRAWKEHGRCNTFAYWSEALSGDDAKALAAQLSADSNSKIKIDQYHRRPAVLSDMSDSALLTLRRSNFLFARKFVPSGSLLNFRRIVLAKEGPPRTLQALSYPVSR